MLIATSIIDSGECRQGCALL
uniref:Uncharacterized protein n=1 Tax=Anguilla anguilla TaxID=7936 RepID=A0A0E9VW69_ANGAN